MIRAVIACVAVITRLVAIACVAAILASQFAKAEANEPAWAAWTDATSSIQRFLTARDTPLVSYRAFRVLEAGTRGGRIRAQLCACTELAPSGAFHYSIVEEHGSEIIRKLVLHAALDAERSLRAKGEIAKGELNTTNYDFGDGGDAETGFVRIAMHPKRQDTLLVDGNMLLTRQDADLVSVEGLLSKRPSFWTRRVDVRRQYSRIDGVRVPVSLRSTAQVLLVGASTFSMTYEYEAINGRTQQGTQHANQCPAMTRDGS
jgi:hypothetical protein